MLCDAGYTTYLLGTWVRDREVMSLEHAIRRITTEPAAFYGIEQRGRIAPGLAADFAIFDLSTVGSKKRGEMRTDLPGGGPPLGDAGGRRRVHHRERKCSLRAEAAHRGHAWHCAPLRTRLVSYRLGVDVGGTFTDVLVVDDATGRRATAKVPSTDPADSSIGVLNGIARACERAEIDPKQITQVMHGTTGGDQRHADSRWCAGRTRDHGRLPPGPADCALFRARRSRWLGDLRTFGSAGTPRAHRGSPGADRCRWGRGAPARRGADPRVAFEASATPASRLSP